MCLDETTPPYRACLWHAMTAPDPTGQVTDRTATATSDRIQLTRTRGHNPNENQRGAQRAGPSAQSTAPRNAPGPGGVLD